MGNGATTLNNNTLEKGILVVGLQGSGKTSLIHSLEQLQQGLNPHQIFPPSTREPKISTIRLNQEKYTVIDGPTSEKVPVDIAAYIYVLDSTDSIRLPHVARELKALKPAVRTFIVATKMDLPQAENPEKELQEFLPINHDFVALSVFETSDLTVLYKQLCSLQP